MLSVQMCIYPTCPSQAGRKKKVNFLTSFPSKTSYLIKTNEPSRPYYLLIAIGDN